MDVPATADNRRTIRATLGWLTRAGNILALLALVAITPLFLFGGGYVWAPLLLLFFFLVMHGDWRHYSTVRLILNLPVAVTLAGGFLYGLGLLVASYRPSPRFDPMGVAQDPEARIAYAIANVARAKGRVAAQNVSVAMRGIPYAREEIADGFGSYRLLSSDGAGLVAITVDNRPRHVTGNAPNAGMVDQQRIRFDIAGKVCLTQSLLRTATGIAPAPYVERPQDHDGTPTTRPVFSVKYVIVDSVIANSEIDVAGAESCPSTVRILKYWTTKE